MRLLGVVLCSVALVACGTPLPPAGSSDTGPRPDAFREDSGRDAAALDAPSSADASDAGFVPGSCQFDMATDYFDLDVDPRAHPGPVAMAAGPTSFGVVYSKDDAVGGENLFFVEVPSTSGAPLAPQHVTMGAFVNTRPVIARTTTGWLVAWLSYRDASWEVYALGSGSDGRLLTTPVRITTTASIDELSPALAADGATSALAWAEPGPPTTTVVQMIGADAMPSGAPTRLSPSGFSMIPASLAAGGGAYLVGWGDPSGDALIQPLAADGTAVGAPASLTTEHNADGAIDSVISLGGGAVVYGAIPAASRHDVHAHLVDGSGSPILVEHVLTIGADTGTDASITEIGGGYAVAYRQAGTPPMLRILFFDSLLNEVGRSDLVQASASGALTLRTSADGNLLLTWADVIGTTTMVRGLRLRCQ